MSEQEFRELLQALIDQASDMDDEQRDENSIDAEWQDARTRTFEEAGLLIRDKGIVVRLATGELFQLTVLRAD